MHPKVIEDTITRMRQLGGVVTIDTSTDLLNVNGEFTASVVIARCRQTEAGAFRWLIRLDAGLKPDITVAVRMDAINGSPQELGKSVILRGFPGFLKSDVFGVGHGHTLRFQ
jgi:hypothetical protein